MTLYDSAAQAALIAGKSLVWRCDSKIICRLVPSLHFKVGEPSAFSTKVQMFTGNGTSWDFSPIDFITNAWEIDEI